MENSVKQARNVIGAFAVDAAEIMEGPVLLVDDMVDSRWSITVCGVALREAAAVSSTRLRWARRPPVGADGDAADLRRRTGDRTRMLVPGRPGATVA